MKLKCSMEAALLRVEVSSPPVHMDPELLMAASRGDHEYLQLVATDEMQITTEAPPGETMPSETVLHVVAASGDNDKYLQSAQVIYDKDKTLLDKRNTMGDTPLHCAARAGNSKMLSRLIDFAHETSQHPEPSVTVQEVLRAQNKRGETVLHEAVRRADEEMIKELLGADPGLASITPVPEGSASSLYLATSMGLVDIVRILTSDPCVGASCAGPNGANALHAAVIESKELTGMLLKWRKNLANEADNSGSTALHHAASVPGQNLKFINFILRYRAYIPRKEDGVATLLLKAKPSAAYQPDKEGSFPIHVAATVGATDFIIILLRMFPDTANLRDAEGRTFLHVAVAKERRNVVYYICGEQKRFANILNLTDKHGDTALHLAVQTRNMSVFRLLISNREVRLNIENQDGLTPLDLALIIRSTAREGMTYYGNPDMWIAISLGLAGARLSNQRWDWFLQKYISQQNKQKLKQSASQRDTENLVEETEGTKYISRKKEKLEEEVKSSTQNISIGAVLTATVAFAAAFALPGGYRADDHANGGTPTLARTYAFQVFIIANTFAFVSSVLSTIGLIYAGAPGFVAEIRVYYLRRAINCLKIAFRCMIVAFAFGLYVVLAPVAHTTAVIVCVITLPQLLREQDNLNQLITYDNVLRRRMGIQGWFFHVHRSTMLRVIGYIPGLVLGLPGLMLLAVVVEYWFVALMFGLPLVLPHS